MGWSIFKRNPIHVHEWKTVAYDVGYSFTDENKRKRTFNVRYEKCSCGERRFKVDKKPDPYHEVDDHSSLAKSRERWVHGNYLQLTDDSEVFDADYQNTQPPGASSCGIWRYKPVTDVDVALTQLKSVPEFQKLRKHQMVDDAFKQLETVVAMHENIEAKDDEDE